MKFIFCDKNKAVYDELVNTFDDVINAITYDGSCLDFLCAADIENNYNKPYKLKNVAIVCPINALGNSDSGLIYDIVKLYPNLKKKIKKKIKSFHLKTFRDKNYCPIGGSFIIEESDIRFICVPTMLTNQNVSETENAYWAMLAIKNIIIKYNKKSKNIPINTIILSGLCTGVGKMSPENSISQMNSAFTKPPDRQNDLISERKSDCYQFDIKENKQPIILENMEFLKKK